MYYEYQWIQDPYDNFIEKIRKEREESDYARKAIHKDKLFILGMN